jgi:uncharacterized protein YndB with AHSA1/START domain
MSALAGSPAANNAAIIEPLVHEAVIDGSPDDVWAAFTTKAGIESWMVAHAEIDLRIGGKLRTHYRKEGMLGDEGTIENTILCYDPKKMISIKVATFPKGFRFPKAIENMWTNIYFEPAGASRTKVTVRGLGWTEDEESQQMRKFFDSHNKQTLDSLIGRFKAK